MSFLFLLINNKFIGLETWGGGWLMGRRRTVAAVSKIRDKISLSWRSLLVFNPLLLLNPRLAFDWSPKLLKLYCSMIVIVQLSDYNISASLNCKFDVIFI